MFAMYAAYVREKARQLRPDRHLSIDEIALRLALPKTTVYYWMKDIPLGRPRRASVGQRAGNEGMQRKYKLLRDAAYAQGRQSFERLAADPTFRDFICLYLGEGSKRGRNVVAICNSDPTIINLANRWITRFSRNPVAYTIQYHADQDLNALREFWAAELGIRGDIIRLQRKSNAGALAGRTWRSRYGVLTVRAADTLLRSRLQAWMDSIRETWV
jgi:hypothetical protein